MNTFLEQPVRVLHVVKSLGLGGTEKAMQLMVCHLDRALFSPYVYALETGPRHAQLKEAGVPVIIGHDLLELLEKLSPQVVHIHRAGWPEAGMLDTVLRYRPKALVETNVFGRMDDTTQGRRIDLHLLVSHFCLDRLARSVDSLPPQSYRVLYNPVDTDLFLAKTPQQDFSLPVAGRLSRPDPGKWSAMVFETLPRLAALVPDFQLVVIGATGAFAEFTAARGLSGNVVFLDPVHHDQDLARFFGRISVLAHANDVGESFGMAIAEAMAAGLPVVTHPAQGLRDNAQLELVEHGVTGIVARTADEYAQALAWLWRNPDQARRMGLAGREKAQANYRAQDIAARLGQYYLELLRT